MGRRGWGAAVVALTLIAALILPSFAGRRVVGSAARVPVPGPPEVGQCLLSDGGGSLSPLYFHQVVVPTAAVGPCGDENYGEVVSVTLDPDSFPVTVSGRMSHPDPLACQPIASGYLGWDVPGADLAAGGGAVGETAAAAGGRDPGPWRPVSTASTGLFGPGLWQYLSGQTWLACVVYPQDAPYEGSVRNGSAGSAADAYGSCWGETEQAGPQAVPCSEPHRVENFAAAAAAGADPAALAASCRDLVRAATGMTDPSAGGELLVGVDVGVLVEIAQDAAAPIPLDSAVPIPLDSAVPAPLAAGVGTEQAACTVSVVGARHLGASLTAIGDGAVPWA